MIVAPMLLAAALSARDTLVKLEDEWLHARDAAALDRVVAADFIHVVPSGDFLTKAQHIAWFQSHPTGGNPKSHLENMNVRLYGGVAIVNGTVAAPDHRSVFTDVFVLRDGRWQAVSAQENATRP